MPSLVQKYALDCIPGAIVFCPYSPTGGVPFAAGGLNRRPVAGKKGVFGVGPGTQRSAGAP